MGKKARMLNHRVPGIDIEMRRAPSFLTERSLVAAPVNRVWIVRSFSGSIGGSALALGGRVFKTGGQLLAPAGGAALEAGVHPVNGAVRF